MPEKSICSYSCLLELQGEDLHKLKSRYTDVFITSPGQTHLIQQHYNPWGSDYLAASSWGLAGRHRGRGVGWRGGGEHGGIHRSHFYSLLKLHFRIKHPPEGFSNFIWVLMLCQRQGSTSHSVPQAPLSTESMQEPSLHSARRRWGDFTPLLFIW